MCPDTSHIACISHLFFSFLLGCNYIWLVYYQCVRCPRSSGTVFAGAARAAETKKQGNSHAAALPSTATDPTNPTNPATAVKQQPPQPSAASASAPGLSAAAASGSVQSVQLESSTQPQMGSAMGSDTSTGSSNAVIPLAVGSTGQQQPPPADFTGLVATAVDSSEYAQGLEPAMQLMRKQGQGQEEDQGMQQEFSEPVRGLADPNKRLLAKMGSEVPADVSKQLLQELGARAQVQGLLQVCNLSSAFCSSPYKPTLCHATVQLSTVDLPAGSMSDVINSVINSVFDKVRCSCKQHNHGITKQPSDPDTVLHNDLVPCLSRHSPLHAAVCHIEMFHAVPHATLSCIVGAPCARLCYTSNTAVGWLELCFAALCCAVLCCVLLFCAVLCFSQSRAELT